MTTEQAAARASLPRLLVVILLSRTILNVAYRAVYPFLPFIAADLGVSLQAAAEIIQSRNLVGLTAPLFGPLSDRYGRRALMLLGIGVAVVASLALGAFSSFAFAILAIAVITFGKTLYDPAQQAYLGDVVPYASRGRAISLSETSWSTAALVGLPLVGIIVQLAGWRAGFVALGGVGVLSLVLTRVALPAQEHRVSASNRVAWGRTFSQIARQPGALGVLIAGMLNAASNENVNIVFSAWMKNSFLLDAVALGAVASVLGVAELCGELFSSGLVDRLGKHRLVAVSLLCASAAYALLPWLGQNAWLASAGLFLSFFFFEISVVAALPLITEIVPHARGTLMSLNVAAFALGRTLGSFSGPYLFLNQGFAANGLVSGVGVLLSLGAWQFLVREHH